MAWDSNKYIGKNVSSSGVDTSNVTANADGTLLERVEYLQTCMGGLSGQLRFQQSASTVIEEDSYAQFEITLIDINSGAITSANINIASITVELSKSTGGGAFSAIGITQPTFSKADGRVYTSTRFLDAEWAVGDVYKLTVKDIVVTFGTEYAYVPQMVWCNLITDIIGIDSVVDDIKTYTGRIQDTAVTVGMTSGSLASFIAGNNGGLGGTLPASTSLYDVVKYLTNVADSGTVTPTKVLDNSILAIILSKVSGGDVSSFDNSTDSLEAIADAIANGSRSFAATSNGAAGKNTIVSTTLTEADDYWNGCLVVSTSATNLNQARIIVDFDSATDTLTVVPAFANQTLSSDTFIIIAGMSIYDYVKNLNSVAIDASCVPVANTLTDILHKDTSYTYDNTTDSLEAIRDAITTVTTLLNNNAGDVACVSAHMDTGTTLHVIPATGYTDGVDDATTVDLTTVDADLVTANIKNGVTILGVAGSTTVRDVSDWTDAVEGDVTTGKKFYKADGSQATGTL